MTGIAGAIISSVMGKLFGQGIRSGEQKKTTKAVGSRYVS
jgi:hypothetical protein